MCDTSFFPATDPDEQEFTQIDEAYIAETILQEYVAWESSHRGLPDDEPLTMQVLSRQLRWLVVGEKELVQARIALWKQSRLHLRYRVKPDAPNMMNGSGYEFVVE